MTENEKITQIKWLIEKHPVISKDKDFIEPLKDAIKAIDKVQAFEAIGTIEEFKALKLKEHNYDNCHNYTCRKKCEKDGYAKAIDEFAEKFIFKAVCEGCSGCCDCYENETQNTCEDWKYYMEIVEQMKGGAE